MKEEIPKCNSCSQSMFEIGETGGKVSMFNGQNLIGIRSVKIYQCPECKDVKIN